MNFFCKFFTAPFVGTVVSISKTTSCVSEGSLEALHCICGLCLFDAAICTSCKTKICSIMDSGNLKLHKKLEMDAISDTLIYFYDVNLSGENTSDNHNNPSTVLQAIILGLL